MLGRTAFCKMPRHGIGARAIHARGDTLTLAPATAGILDDTGIIECPRVGSKLGIAPNGTELVKPGAARLAGGEVHGRTVVGVTGHLKHRFLWFATGIDPALDHLDALQRQTLRVGGIGTALGRDQQRWRSRAVCSSREFASHRHAARIALGHAVRICTKVILKVPAGKQPGHNTRPTGGVGFTPLQALKQRLSCILFGPDNGQAAGVVFQLVGQPRTDGIARGIAGATVPQEKTLLCGTRRAQMCVSSIPGAS